MAKRWTKDEITYLKRYAKRKTLSDLVGRCHTDASSVQAKLDELGLAAIDSPTPLEVKVDPMIAVFGRALKALHREKWAEASGLLERVIEETAQHQLAGSARRYLGVCQRNIQAAKGGKKSSDPFLVAVYERNRGDLDAASELCKGGGRRNKDERFAYLAAAIYSVQEDFENAAKYLGLAIEMNPKNRIHAGYDSDFDGLRQEPEYEDIFSS
jgi:tetratricopeptide (TPR) repeat protein